MASDCCMCIKENRLNKKTTKKNIIERRNLKWELKKY